MIDTQQPIRLLHTPKQAATLLGCCENTVRRLIEGGELRAVDIAPKGSKRSKTRVRDDDLRTYINKHTRVCA